MARKPVTVRDAQRDLDAAKLLREQIADLAGGDEDFIRDTLEGETNLDEILNMLLDQEALDAAMVRAINATASTLADRKKRIEKRIETARTLMATGLEIAGITKFEGTSGTVSVSEKKPSVIVTDESELPSRFWKQPDPVVDKTLLNAAVYKRVEELQKIAMIEDVDQKLAAKELVDLAWPPINGVELGNGGVTVMIRR